MILRVIQSSKSESRSHSRSFPCSPQPGPVEFSGYVFLRSTLSPPLQALCFLARMRNLVLIHKILFPTYFRNFHSAHVFVSSISYQISLYSKSSHYLHGSIQHKLIQHLVLPSGVFLLQKWEKTSERYEHSHYLLHWFRMSIQFLVKTIEAFKYCFSYFFYSERL